MRHRERPQSRFMGSLVDLLTFLVLSGLSMSIFVMIATSGAAKPSAASKSDRTERVSSAALGDLARESEEIADRLAREVERKQALEERLRQARRAIPPAGRTQDSVPNSMSNPTPSATQSAIDQAAADAIAKQLQASRDSLAAIRKDLAAVDRQIRAARATSATKVVSPSELLSLEAERDRLKREAGSSSGEVKIQGGTSLVRNDSDLTPVFLMLRRHKVLPLQDPYFDIGSVSVPKDGGTVDVSYAIRQKPGLAMDEALQSGSDVMQVVNGLDRDKSYICVFVDGPSFPEFRKLRDEFRRMGVAYGWEPAPGDTILFSVGGRETGVEVNR
jgi:hypothetical protein